MKTETETEKVIWKCVRCGSEWELNGLHLSDKPSSAVIFCRGCKRRIKYEDGVFVAMTVPEKWRGDNMWGWRYIPAGCLCTGEGKAE